MTVTIWRVVSVGKNPRQSISQEISLLIDILGCRVIPLSLSQATQHCPRLLVHIISKTVADTKWLTRVSCVYPGCGLSHLLSKHVRAHGIMAFSALVKFKSVTLDKLSSTVNAIALSNKFHLLVVHGVVDS